MGGGEGATEKFVRTLGNSDFWKKIGGGGIFKAGPINDSKNREINRVWAPGEGGR